MQKIIDIKDGIARMPEWRMANPVNFELYDNEHIAIIGNNGAGKSMLADIISGRHPISGTGIVYNFAPNKKELISDNIKYITFRDSYGDYDNTYFLQQRWNQHEIDKETPTVRNVLDSSIMNDGQKTSNELRNHLYDIFDIEQMLDKYIILLSSGEMRKLILVRALLSEPRVLIIDNPFIGLDTETRQQLKELLQTVSQERALQIIAIISKTDDIPNFITHVVEVKDMKVMQKKPLDEYLISIKKTQEQIPQCLTDIISNIPYHNNEYNSKNVVIMNNVTIKYGDRTILNNINWTIKNGEYWALSGKNGSGKSTILSLICADNPQAYACNITLFDKKRGSGESIWDIKKHIGYVSPEMHRAFKHNIPSIQIVAGGFKDTMGLYSQPSKQEYETCNKWLEIFGIKDLADKTFFKLSSGQQRLVLLARAFVKDPELLILDEPFHGLDDKNRQLVREIINAFCKRKNKTMIIVCHYDEELPQCINNKIHLKRNIK